MLLSTCIILQVNCLQNVSTCNTYVTNFKSVRFWLDSSCESVLVDSNIPVSCCWFTTVDCRNITNRLHEIASLTPLNPKLMLTDSRPAPPYCHFFSPSWSPKVAFKMATYWANTSAGSHTPGPHLRSNHFKDNKIASSSDTVTIILGQWYGPQSNVTECTNKHCDSPTLSSETDLLQSIPFRCLDEFTDLPKISVLLIGGVKSLVY